MSLLKKFSNILILKNPLKDKKLCLFARFIIQVIYFFLFKKTYKNITQTILILHKKERFNP